MRWKLRKGHGRKKPRQFGFRKPGTSTRMILFTNRKVSQVIMKKKLFGSSTKTKNIKF